MDENKDHLMGVRLWGHLYKEIKIKAEADHHSIGTKINILLEESLNKTKLEHLKDQLNSIEIKLDKLIGLKR